MQRFHNQRHFWIQPAGKPNQGIQIRLMLDGWMDGWMLWSTPVPCTGQSNPTWMTWSLLGRCRSDMHPRLRSTHPQEKRTLAACRNTSSAVGEREEVNREGDFPRPRWCWQWAIAHLQAEGRHHGLVVTDSVAHVTGVFVLCDQERILIQSIISRGQCCLMVIVIVFWGRSFGFDAPQDSIRPGWFSFLPAECNNVSFVFSTLNKCFERQPKYWTQ